MSDYTVISEVGKTLVNLLWNEIHADQQVASDITSSSQLSLESPAALKDNASVQVSIYLYRVTEDPHTKNRFPIPGNGGNFREASLSLDLYYMITPLFGDAVRRHVVLGKIMQTLYDHAILQDADLTASMLQSGNDVRVLLNPVPLDEIARVWQALEMSYQLSVCYVLRVALLDSKRERSLARVLVKTTSYGQAGENN